MLLEIVLQKPSFLQTPGLGPVKRTQDLISLSSMPVVHQFKSTDCRGTAPHFAGAKTNFPLNVLLQVL